MRTLNELSMGPYYDFLYRLQWVPGRAMLVFFNAGRVLVSLACPLTPWPITDGFTIPPNHLIMTWLLAWN